MIAFESVSKSYPGGSRTVKDFSLTDTTLGWAALRLSNSSLTGCLPR